MAASRESLSLQCDEAALYSPDEAAALHDSPDEAVLYSPDEAAALLARLCEALLGVASYAHIVNPELEIPEESLPELQAALERLAAGEPLQYVLGYADFLGMRLHVTPAVLIPRPETEELCRRVIESYPHISTGLSSDPTAPASASSPHISAPTAPASGSSSHIFESAVSANPSLPRAILDLCCGSGCITWAMARAFPDALVVGVDLSAEALDVARSQNAAIDGFIQADGVLAEPRTPSGAFSSRLSAPLFIQADALQVSELLQTLKALLKEYGCSGFDLLLSNPPYVRERERKQMRRNVLDFEPEMALFVPDDDPLRFYKVSAELFSSELFSPHSFAALELNEALGESTAALFQEKKCAVHLQKDVFEKTRFLFAKK